MKYTIHIRKGLFLIAAVLLTIGRRETAAQNCDPIGLPFTENFNTYSTLPDCWLTDQNFDSELYMAHVVTDQKYEGIGSLMMSAGNNTSASHMSFVMARRLNQSPTGIRMRMRVMSTHAGAVLRVGVCESNTTIFDQFGFEEVQSISIPQANTWISVEVDFSAYNGIGDRPSFAMYQAQQPAGGVRVYIDALTIERCAVDNLRVSHRSDTELTLHWTTIGQGTADLTATPQGGGAEITISEAESPCRITGLQPQTTYTLTLTPHCDGEEQNGIAQSIEGTTLAARHVGTAYCEDFESSSLPTDWTATGTAAPTTAVYYNGNRSLYLASASTNSAALPLLSTSAGTPIGIADLQLTFRMRTTTAASGLQICAADYPEESTEFTPIDTVRNALSGVWALAAVDLSHYGGEKKYIVLRAIGGGVVYVDDLRAGRCLLTGERVSERTATSITLEWDVPMADGDVIIDPLSGGGSMLTVGPAQCTTEGGKRRYTIEGLAPGSTHTYAIYGTCDADHCGAAILTSTTYAANRDLPLCENFDQGSALPADWSGENATISTTQSHSRWQSLQLSRQGTQQAIAVLPPAEGTVAAVSFAAYTTSSGCIVDIGTTNADGGDFSGEGSATLISGQWTRYSVSLDLSLDGSRRLAIRLRTTTTAQRTVWIDDLAAAAAGVWNTESFGERSDGATIQWTTDADSVDLVLRRSGNAQNITHRNAESPFVAAGLQQNTTYDYYLRTYAAGGEEGCLVYGGSFSTNAGALTADYCHPTSISVGTTPWHLNYLEEDSYTGLWMSLKAYRYSGNGSLQLGLMTDDGDAQSFTPISTFNPSSGQWEHCSAALTGRESSGHYPALRATSGTFSVEKLRISRGNIVSHRVENISATGAVVRWTTEGTVDSIEVQVGNSVYATVAATAGSIALQNLQPGTTYLYTLTAKTNASAQSCSVDEGNIITLDDDIANGFCTDFEQTVYGSLPTGWTYTGGNGSDPAVYQNGGSHKLRLTSSSGNSATVILPAAASSVGGMVLRMQAYTSTATAQRARLMVGVMENGAAGQTFVPTDTVLPTSAKKIYTLSLSRYTGTGHNIALRFESSDAQRQLYIDNLGIEAAQIGEVEAMEITATSVRLWWKGNGSAAISGVRDTVGTGGSVLIDGLTPNSQYSFSLSVPGAETSVCNSVPISIHTLPMSMTPPLCLDLDDYNSANQLPYGWTRNEEMQYPRQSTSTRYQGTRSIELRGSDYGSVVVSPMIETESLQSLYLSFMMRNPYSSGTLQVGTMTDPTNEQTFTVLAEYNYASSWTRAELPLSNAPAGAHYIAWRYVSDYTSYYAHIDQVQLRSCAMPTLSLQNPRPGTLDVHWSGADSVHIEWGTGSSTAGSISTGTSPYTITGLSNNTNYTVRLWPICEGEEDFVCHKLEATMRTPPPPPQLPYCQQFSYGTPSGWNLFWENGSANVDNTYESGYDYALRMYAYGGGNAIAVLPKLSIGENLCNDVQNLYINLTAKRSYGDCTLEVGTIHNTTLNGLDFVPIATVQLSDTWEEHTIALPRAAVRDEFIALRMQSTDGNSEVYIDRICTGYCFSTAVYVSERTSESITIEWESHGAEGLRIFRGGWDTVVYENPYTLHGLHPNESYTFDFAATCPCNLPNSYGVSLERNMRMPAEPMELPMCRDFEDDNQYSFPDEWRRTGGRFTSYPQVSNNTSHSGSKCLHLYTSWANPLTVALEPLADTVTSDLVLSGWINSDVAEMAQERRLMYGTMEDPENASSFIPIGSITIDATHHWESFHVLIPHEARGTNRYIALYYDPSTTYNVYLDDLSVGRCAVDTIRTDYTTLYVSTIGAAEGYTLNITNSAGETRQRVLTASQTALSTLGLSDDSVYTLSATALCSGEDTALCNRESIVVGERIELPYCMTFEDEQDLQPAGWHLLKHNSPYYPRAESGIYHLQPNSDDIENNDIVELPAVPNGRTLGGLNVRIDVEYPSFSEIGYAYLQLGYLSGGTFHPLQEIHNTQIRQTHYTTLPACTATRLCIRARSTNGATDIYIDNLQLSTYPEPSVYTLPQTSYARQHIYWPNSANNMRYDIKWGEAGFDPESGTLTASDSCHALLMPTEAQQMYDFYFVDTAGKRFCYAHQFSTLPPSTDLPYCDDDAHYLSAGNTLMLPEVEIPISGLTLIVEWSGTTGSQLIVGAQTDLSDRSTYIGIDTLTTTEYYTTRRDIVRLSSYADTGRFVGLQCARGTCTIRSITLQSVPIPTFHTLSSTEIEVSVEDEEADYYLLIGNETHHITSTKDTLRGLEEYTQYEIYVSADGQPVCTAPIQVRTHLDIEPPYCYRGDLTGWYADGRFLTMPHVSRDSLTGLYLTVRSRGTVTIGVQQTLDDTASFTELLTATNTTWTDSTIRLSDYTTAIGHKQYISFRGGQLQEVLLYACPVPKAELTAFNTVSFTQEQEGVEYWVEYNDTVVRATGNPFSISNLGQNQEYHFSYRCDSTTATCLPTADITTGVQIKSPFCAWLNNSALDGSTPMGTAGWFAHSSGSGEKILSLPIIDLDSANSLYVRLRYRIAVSGTALEVGVMTDPNDNSTFSTVERYSEASTAYREAILSLRQYRGEGLYVALRASGNVPQRVYIDRIELQTVPFATYSVETYNSVRVEAEGMPQPKEPFYIVYGDNRIYTDTLPYLVEGLPTDTEYLFSLQQTEETPACADATAVRTTHPIGIPSCDEQLTLSATNALWRGPEIIGEDISTLQIRFDAQFTGDGKSVAIGTMRIHNDDSTFEPLDTISLTAGRTRYSASLSSHREGRFLGIRLLPTTEGGSVGISNISIDHCILPSSASVSLLRHNIVRLDCSEEEALENIHVEYGTEGFELGTGESVEIDSLPMDFLLANSTTYQFYLVCNNSETTCAEPLTIRTLDQPPTLSWCTSFDDQPVGQMPANWMNLTGNNAGQWVRVAQDNYHSTGRSLSFRANIDRNAMAIMPDIGRETMLGIALSFWMMAQNENAEIEVGVIFNTADPTTFRALHTIRCKQAGVWERKLIDLNEAPDSAYFMAIRCSGAEHQNVFWIDDLHVAECGASDFAITEVEASDVTLSWRQTGSPSISIDVEPGGTIALADSAVYGTRTYTIRGLDPLTNYKFRLHTDCDNEDAYCSTGYTDSARVFTPAGGTGCIDPTNLTASYTTCTFGSYGNPYADTAAVDYGYASSLSRHTVHYDTEELDPRTGNHLHTVPEGAVASVRLGNWNTGGEGESIMYGLSVDTMEFDMLIMRYAAVLQDKMHAATEQPRFSLGILDENMNIIDSVCGLADFVANHQMGWHAEQGEVLWKDWTTVGLDLTPYAGQSIYIRLTTRDCGEGNHYGYAYFTLECGHKHITTSACGVVAENNLSVPSGFAYRWYTTTDTTTLSREQQITVPSNNEVTYLCNLSIIDKEECLFTMSAFAGTRFPLSLFDYETALGQCSVDVGFTNHSTISMDQINPIGTGEGVESSVWDFGNGETSNILHPTTTYYEPGNYTVTLITGIANDACLDTLSLNINIAFPETGLRIEGPTERCHNSAPDTLHLYNVCDDWMPSDSNWIFADEEQVGTHRMKHYIMTIDSASYPPNEYTFSVEALDSVGCTVSLSHTITVYPTYLLHETARICSLLLPYTWHDTILNDANTNPIDTLPYTLHRYSVHGCDSTTTLSLLLHDNAYYTKRDTAFDAICDNGAYFFSDSLLHGTPGIGLMQYTDSLQTDIGCDSLSTIVLTIHPTFDHLLQDTVCSNTAYSWGTPYRQMLATTTKTIVTHAIDTATSQYSAPMDTSFTDHLTTVYGCDSLSTLQLHIFSAYNLQYNDTMCASHIENSTWQMHEYSFMGTAYNTTGVYTHQRNTHEGNCDSVRTLRLKVNPTYDLTFYDAICDNETYLFSDSLLVGERGIGTIRYTDTLSTIARCDSLATIVLTVRPTYDHLLQDTVCSNTTYNWGTPNRQMFATTYKTTNTHANDTANSQYRAPIDTSFTDRLHSVYGCDSLSTLQLHIFSAYNLQYSDTICTSHLENITWVAHDYNFMGTVYDTTGLYTHQRSTREGNCDSVRTLRLKVYPTYDIHHYDTIYDGDSYTFETTVYDTTGIYPTMLQAVYSCDSLRTLHLQRNRRTYIDTVVCRNRMPFVWTHTSDAATVNISTTFADIEGQYTRGWVALHDSIHLTGRDGIDSMVVMTVFSRDTSSTTDPVHSCDSFYWNNDNRLYYASTTSPYVVYPQLSALDTAGFHDELPTGRRADFSHQLFPYAIQCDSVRHLSLKIDYTHYYTDTLIGCDSLYWRNRTWYYADTLGQVGPLGSRQTTGPVDTLTTTGGCDSVVNLDLAIRYATYHCDIDTFCWHELYTWREHTIGDTLTNHWPTTEDYYVSDTLQTHRFVHPSSAAVGTTCDSVRAIALTQMARPQLFLQDTIDCATSEYTLRISTDVPYVQWTNGDADIYANTDSIIVSPSHITTYYAYVDYHNNPLCPLTDSLRMRPIVVPTAELRINPSVLRYNEMTFEAYDISSIHPNAIHANDPYQWKRYWTINETELNIHNNHIHYEASDADDTIDVRLTVFNGQCYDTTIALIPVLKTSIYAPNAFTPKQETNNLFYIVMKGVRKAELYIYNREGLLVYRSDDPAAGWDGRDLSGRACTQGNYVWKLYYEGIDRPGAERTEVGTVLLIY